MFKKTAQENMSSQLITIGSDEKMAVAYERMCAVRVRHLPVTNASGEIVGMLSDRDVQRAMISRVEGTSGKLLSDETLSFNDESKVCDYMSWPVKSVEQDTDLRMVAEKINAEKVSSLLVTDGKEPVGIITVEDLISVLIEILSDPRTPAQWTLDSVLEGTFARIRGTFA